MNKAFFLTIAAAFLGAGPFGGSTSAQVLISAGSSYTQNFDSLASSGVPPANTNWTDNSTIPGW
jgi:hypothetical protein